LEGEGWRRKFVDTIILPISFLALYFIFEFANLTLNLQYTLMHRCVLPFVRPRDYIPTSISLLYTMKAYTDSCYLFILLDYAILFSWAVWFREIPIVISCFHHDYVILPSLNFCFSIHLWVSGCSDNLMQVPFPQHVIFAAILASLFFFLRSNGCLISLHFITKCEDVNSQFKYIWYLTMDKSLQLFLTKSLDLHKSSYLPSRVFLFHFPTYTLSSFQDIFATSFRVQDY
jgi:hypothetical protein